MKTKVFFLSLILLLGLGILPSCSSEDPIPNGGGSYRDWRYSPEQCTVTIDGVKQTDFKEILVYSKQVANAQDGKPDIFYTTFRIYDLVKGEKYSEISVYADWDKFAGNTVLNGKYYSVEGEFLGNPIENHNSKLGLVISLTAL